MNVCGTEIVEGQSQCPHCKAPHRLDRQGRVPVRACGGTRVAAPCFFQGDPAGTVDCPSCSGAVKLKTFACVNLQVSQQRAARTTKSLPGDVANCLRCEFYQPSPTTPSVPQPASSPPAP